MQPAVSHAFPISFLRLSITAFYNFLKKPFPRSVSFWPGLCPWHLPLAMTERGKKPFLSLFCSFHTFEELLIYSVLPQYSVNNFISISPARSDFLSFSLFLLLSSILTLIQTWNLWLMLRVSSIEPFLPPSHRRLWPAKTIHYSEQFFGISASLAHTTQHWSFHLCSSQQSLLNLSLAHNYYFNILKASRAPQSLMLRLVTSCSSGPNYAHFNF